MRPTRMRSRSRRRRIAELHLLSIVSLSKVSWQTGPIPTPTTRQKPQPLASRAHSTTDGDAISPQLGGAVVAVSGVPPDSAATVGPAMPA